MKTMIQCILLALSLICVTDPVSAGTERYKGSLELLKLSGGACANYSKVGTIFPLELAVSRDSSTARQPLQGYFGGAAIQTGRFSGADADRLEVVYADPDFATGHLLSIQFSGEQASGELREKPLTQKEDGCSFESARLTLKRVVDPLPTDLLGEFETQFRSEQEYSRGQELYDKGLMEQALPHLESALRLREMPGIEGPARIRYPATRLAVVYALKGRYNDAFALIERVVKTADDQKSKDEFKAYAMRLLARQAAKLIGDGLLEQAGAFVQQLRKQFPDAAHFAVAQAGLLAAAGKQEESCRFLEEQVARYSAEPAVKRALAACLTQLGHDVFDRDDSRASLVYFRKALQFQPARPETWGSLLAAYRAQGDFGEAYTLLDTLGTAIIKEYSQKEYNSMKAMFYQEEARQVERRQDDHKAEELYRKALSLDPEEPDIAGGLARVLHKTGRYPEALQLLEQQRGRCVDEVCRKGVEAALQREAQLEKLLRRIE